MEVYYLTGLALDHRIFTPLKDQLGGQVLNWQKPYKNEPLKDYAQRWAATLHNQIKPNSCLIGLCFGGVLAMELAQQIQFNSIVTISTPGDSSDIKEDFREGVKKGVKIPHMVLKGLLTMKGPSFFEEHEALNESHVQLLQSMFKETDFDFLKWAALASAGWDQPEPLSLSCPHLALHGASDKLIRKPKNIKFESFEGLGHLCTLTHPEVVSSRIQQFWKNIPVD